MVYRTIGRRPSFMEYLCLFGMNCINGGIRIKIHVGVCWLALSVIAQLFIRKV